MRATDFEFRQRFWVICFVYFLGFGFYKFDHVNCAAGLAHWIVGPRDPHLDSPAARHVLQGLFALSATLVTMAAWIRTWGSAYLRAEIVHDAHVHTERLVADGPYRYLRNPLYLGNMFLAAGIAFLASRPGAVIIIVGNLIVILRLIGREETALAETQGEPYRAYLNAVHRLWPSLMPRLPAGDKRPEWPQAFLGEAWMWCFAIDGFIFAWRMDLNIYYSILWVSGFIYFGAMMAMKWRRRRKLALAPVESSSAKPS
jgi:protein-S-isoprenylcysteine O-methyltransferase Ste14